MTKERELLFKIVETWGNAAISTEERESWLKDYAKQQGIAFAIHYAKSAISNGYIKPSAIDNDRMEERYTHFIDNQFIEQQNKQA